ncbi:hypothetical protein [Massilia soli]|uniref:Secreted protein n=1 Tax=Massilia soli TaxID=2792854 RepID=A0ABS7SUF2_9BURK|nr:hypothetical protein [Massilia soli]MBZ2209549.1 hypothetical protein [Massilia soli]
MQLVVVPASSSTMAPSLFSRLVLSLLIHSPVAPACVANATAMAAQALRKGAAMALSIMKAQRRR